MFRECNKFASVYTLVALSVDRFLATFHQFGRFRQIRCGLAACAAIWIICLALSTPYWLFSQVVRTSRNRRSCKIQWPSMIVHRVWTYCSLVVGLVAPFGVIATFSLLLLLRVRGRAAAAGGPGSGPSTAAARMSMGSGSGAVDRKWKRRTLPKPTVAPSTGSKNGAVDRNRKWCRRPVIEAVPFTGSRSGAVDRNRKWRPLLKPEAALSTGSGIGAVDRKWKWCPVLEVEMAPSTGTGSGALC